MSNRCLALVALILATCVAAESRLEPQDSISGFAVSRGLLQTPDIAPVNITTVSTPEGLFNAVQAGARDIVITDHLDLTTLPLQSTGICPVGCESPLGPISETRSIRGQCNTQPQSADFPTMNGIDLVPTTTGQCFLLGHDDMLGVVAKNFWVDNLYLRAALPSGADREFHFPALASLAPLSVGNGSVFMTNMIFQGDGEGSVVGIGVDRKVFVQDSLFTSLGGARDLACTECSSGIEARNAVAVDRCTFEKLIAEAGSRYIRAYKGGAVKLTNSTFAAATKIFEVQDTGEDKAIGFYSDETAMKIELTESLHGTRAPSALSEIPEDPDSPGSPLFLSADSAWFLALKEALSAPEAFAPTAAAPTAAAPTEVAPTEVGPTEVAPTEAIPDDPDSIRQPGDTDSLTEDPTDDRDDSSGSSAGIIIAVIVAIIILGLAGFLFYRCRAQKARRLSQSKLNEKVPPEAYGHYMHTHSTGAGPGLHAVLTDDSQTNASTPYSSYGPPSHAPRGGNAGKLVERESSHGSQQSHTPNNVWSSHNGDLMLHAQSSNDPSLHATYDTLAIPTTTFETMEPPRENATMDERMQFLHMQLSTLQDKRLLDRFVLQSEAQRRQGGQGLVAFAIGAHDQLGYAVKFFLHRPSFDAEKDLYRSETLGKLLPQIEAVYDPEEVDGSDVLVDRNGYALPPFIVMEKGESLIDWSKRERSDVFQAVAVLAHVAKRLKDLHATGYVHRDIKPGNIMLLHRKNRWTLIDFGCVARIGALAGLSFTLHYAAPEAVEAFYNGEKKNMADGALDAWALGVVAFELLTRKQAFQMIIQGKNEVVSMLRGEKELPWEGERLLGVERKLGKMKAPVLALLHRDPAQRMTVSEFLHECNALFSVNTEDHYTSVV